METNERMAEESFYRLNIKQSAKGLHYWEFTVRAKTNEELVTRTKEIKDLAINTCESLNQGVGQ